MSNTDETLAKLANEYDETMDPLEEENERFQRLEIEAFEPVMEKWIRPRDLNEHTLRQYRLAHSQWSEFMEGKGRHPALPNADHVAEYLRREVRPESAGGKGNSSRTAVKKYNKLHTAYEYWVSQSVFPHSADHDPFKDGREMVNLKFQQQKAHRMPPIEEVREQIQGASHIRRLAMVVAQFKLGLRAGELINIKLSDINLQNEELRRHYQSIGDNPRIKDKPNAIYVPPRQMDELPMPGREGNKSKKPRVLPLDTETQRVLLRYLLIRPDVDREWVFLTEKTNTKISHPKAVNKAWRDALDEEWVAETEQYREVTSHYGRNYFTTHWEREGVPRQLIKYMRGDTPGDDNEQGKEAIDHYIHHNYGHIEKIYRANIFSLNPSV